jgi:hypothetical protein
VIRVYRIAEVMTTRALTSISPGAIGGSALTAISARIVIIGRGGGIVCSR